MKRSDMWETPTVNGKLRFQSRTQQPVSAARPSGFAGLEGFTFLDRSLTERFLKKSIPLLIIAFLISVAAARGLSLMSSHARMEDAVRQATELTAVMAQATLDDDLQLFEPGNAAATADALNALATTGPDTDLMVIDTAGSVLAATGASHAFTGQSLATVFPDLISARHRTAPGGVMETDLNGVPYQVAMQLVGDNGGMVIALHSMQAANALWRAEINLNVTLFAAMALLLLVVVYAYYAQLNRAEATAGLMAETEARRDAMLLNGETGLWSFDAYARSAVLDGSAATALGLGSAPRQLGLRQLLDLVHPDDRRGFFRRLAPADSGLIETGFRLRQRDGQYIRVDIRAHAGMTDGRIAVSGAAIRTTTANRRKIEAETKRADMFQSAFEAMPQALALWARDGRLALANPAFTKAYDMTPGARREALTVEDDAIIRRRCSENTAASEVRTPCGRWQALTENNLPDGTLLTIGTDITAFKTDEARLQGEQARLREKIATLAATRRRLELKCDALNRALGIADPSTATCETAGIAAREATPEAGVVIRKTVG